MTKEKETMRAKLLVIEDEENFRLPPGGTVIINAGKDTARLQVRVSDDGIGIAADDLPAIFQTAYRAPNSHSFRRGGSGLGLTLASRILEQHGSQLQVRSQPGEGTEFFFELKLATPTSAP